MLIWKNRK